MRSITLAILCISGFSSASAMAQYKGDYLKVGGNWVQMPEERCGGQVKANCQTGNSCEIIIRNTKCTTVRLYQQEPEFTDTANTYVAPLFPSSSSLGQTLYNGNIYIDLKKLHRQPGTYDQGLVNAVLTGNNSYQKIAPIFVGVNFNY